MTVKQWKQVITISVIVIIVVLLALTIFFGIRYSHYANLSEDGSIIDLSEYDDIDTREATRIFKYFNSVDAEGTFDYQSKYSSLYVDNDFNFVDKEGKVCYLTFDDGPNKNVTPQVLDTLKKYDVKATFFVVYRDGSAERALYKRIVEEGHTLAVHTASHNYTKIYSSVDAYLDDFERISKQIESTTGVKPTLFRFPGGSINSYNMEIYHELVAEMIRRGYVYYDWNVTSEDASSAKTYEEQLDALMLYSENKNRIIALLHDTDKNPWINQVVKDYIHLMREKGYQFKALNPSVKPIHFPMP